MITGEIPPALLTRVRPMGIIPGLLDIWILVPHIDPDGRRWGSMVIDMKTPVARSTIRFGGFARVRSALIY